MILSIKEFFVDYVEPPVHGALVAGVPAFLGKYVIPKIVDATSRVFAMIDQNTLRLLGTGCVVVVLTTVTAKIAHTKLFAHSANG